MTIKQGDPVWFRVDMGDGTFLLNAAVVRSIGNEGRAEIEMTHMHAELVSDADWKSVGGELVEIVPATAPFPLWETVSILPGDPRVTAVRLRVQADSLSARDPQGDHLQVLTN